MPEPTSKSPPVSSLTLVATLQPPTPSRAWLTAPHPSLPLIATAHADRSVRVYSLTSTHTLLSTISGGHKRSVRSAAWKPNLQGGENVLATGSFDASVGIWRNWELGSALGALRVSDGSESEKQEKCDKDDEDEQTSSANGTKTATEVGGSTLQTRGENEDEEDDEDWRFAIVLDGHDSEVKSVAWSAGGNLLATCSRDKSVWIWEEVGPDDYETVAVLQEHEGDVKCVAWHPEQELLASASYDDDVRLWREEVDDWGCVATLRKHESTVWCVAWEGVDVHVVLPSDVATNTGVDGASVQKVNVEGGEQDKESMTWEIWLERRQASGPRLLTCSEDKTIRVWRYVPSERVQQSRLSIIRSSTSDEEWAEEATLPQVHNCGIYAVAWSPSGKVASTGGDGAIVVYEERWDPDAKSTVWVVVNRVDAAHGVFEVNHVAWARRRPKTEDSIGGERAKDVECIVSTGDDGSVKIWDLQP